MSGGAPQGNQNAAKAKQWSAAIQRAVERLGDPSIDPDKPFPRSPKQKGMDMLAEEFVKARDWRELGDRIDGKPAQQLIHSGDEDAPLVAKIVREVAAPLKNGGGGGPK